MGLKNITDLPEKVKYNGVEKVVNPGEVFDVRDFNINNTEVMSVEAMLSEKHRRPISGGGESKVFEHSQTLSNMTDKEINAEIIRLREEIEEIKEGNAPLETQLLESTNEINRLNADLLAARTDVTTLTTQLDESKDKIKDLKDKLKEAKTA